MLKLKREIAESLQTAGVCSTQMNHDKSEMLLRDLDELSEMKLGARERFLVMRMESVLCERPVTTKQQEED